MHFRESGLHQTFRRLFLLFDYLFWMISDPSKFKEINRERIKKVLVVNLGAIGETISILPSIKAINGKISPEIIFLGNKNTNKVILEGREVKKIIPSEGFFRDLKKIKEENADLAVIFTPCSFKINLLCLLSGIKYRIGGFSGLRRFPSIFLTRKTLPIKNKHAVEMALDVVKLAGVEVEEKNIELVLNEEEKKSAEAKMREIIGTKKYVVIHPWAGKPLEAPSRIWPSKRYSRVVDHLTKKGYLVLLNGIDEEIEFSKEILKKSKEKFKIKLIHGKFSIRESGHLLSKSSLLVAPSTSTVHIASAFNTPTINLLSKEMDKYAWKPLSEKSVVLFNSKTQFNQKKKRNEGFLELHPNKVIKAIDSLLG